MNTPSPRLGAVAASVGVLLLALPVARRTLEQAMSVQMLLQFPLLVLAGWLLARALPARCRHQADRWNNHGIPGLLAVALVLAISMVPRVLDLALVDSRVEFAKFVLLVGCGSALQLSWHRAGHLVQGFFLGNVLPMTAAVGQLYQDSPVRLCNAYLLGDQTRLGLSLVVLAVLFGVAWIGALFRRMSMSNSSQLLPKESS
ncbi:hypothetical protein H8N03_17210 [Ramlibacter sp. USB13]|uniref:Uncharacterized protein n=1 Tax=Ramlibacter cellulosilyticus TaxID=2764187 RepID=A0A923SC79_9BURK|nr:hypothetical protein [Ramlibacter cellulosilyticus]MBC5784691.1 hypothetical protein [Ramlibacter cellulosilyticus]